MDHIGKEAIFLHSNHTIWDDYVSFDLLLFTQLGMARTIDGDNDGIALVDMGAYETELFTEPVIEGFIAPI